MSYLIINICYLLINFSGNYENVKKQGVQKMFSDSIVKVVTNLEKDQVIKSANRFLTEKPKTVTAFYCSRSAGGPHDFFSEGPYWWSDPVNPKGPYIRKDGLRNPENFEEHDNALSKSSRIIATQTSAYLLTGKEEYVKAEMTHLKAWFVDTTTRMNPNLLYAQAINGICTGRGIGIIDAVCLIEVARSVKILEMSQYVQRQDIIQIKEWFSQFLNWLTTHQYGIDEMNAKNNHGTWWLAQASAYASLVNNREILEKCNKLYKEVIISGQMSPNGSFPLELERTKPYSYSLFNLDAMAEAAWILSEESFDAWNYTLSDGRGLKKRARFHYAIY